MQIRFSHHHNSKYCTKKKTDNIFFPILLHIKVYNMHHTHTRTLERDIHQTFGVEILRFQFDLHQCWIEYDADFLYLNSVPRYSSAIVVVRCISCNFHCDQVLHSCFLIFTTISRSVALFVFPVHCKLCIAARLFVRSLGFVCFYDITIDALMVKHGGALLMILWFTLHIISTKQ